MTADCQAMTPSFRGAVLGARQVATASTGMIARNRRGAPPSDLLQGPGHDLAGDLCEGRVERRDVGAVVRATDRDACREHLLRPYRAIAVVEQLCRDFDTGVGGAVGLDLEGADIGDDLEIDRQPLARLADAAEAASVFKGLDQL